MKIKYYILLIILLLFICLIYNNSNIDNFKDLEKLKVAVFFSGRILNYELELNHLIKLQKKYDATFFVSVNESSELEYMKRFFKEFSIGDDQKNINITPSSDILSVCAQAENTNPSNIFSMYYHNYKCYNLINNYQTKNNILFDIIVKYRVDINSNDIIDLNKPETNAVYIPEEFDWGGINDQIAYGDNNSMKLYCSIYEILDKICMKNIKFHPESILKGGLLLLNLKIMRFIYKYDLHKNIVK
jgi:hypothetical protein